MNFDSFYVRTAEIAVWAAGEFPAADILFRANLCGPLEYIIDLARCSLIPSALIRWIIDAELTAKAAWRRYRAPACERSYDWSDDEWLSILRRRNLPASIAG